MQLNAPHASRLFSVRTSFVAQLKPELRRKIESTLREYSSSIRIQHTDASDLSQIDSSDNQPCSPLQPKSSAENRISQDDEQYEQFRDLARAAGRVQGSEYDK
eukprot:5062001-Pyramimonas_sp.AAC.1